MINLKLRMRIVMALTATLVVGVGASYRFGGAVKETHSAPVAPLVTATTASRVDLPLTLSAQGHLVGLAQVDVRPQATGTIRSIHFREGQQVAAGQPLFTIDASDATAQLAHSQALAGDIRAQLIEAQHQLTRAQQLAQAQYFSQSAVDTAQSKVDSVQAQLNAAMADVENSRTLVERTHVLSPMTGLTGALSVHVGSLAQQGGAAALVNIIQMDPIGVEFSLPEENLPDLLAARAAGDVKVAIISATKPPINGHLVFVNNTVNADSGMIVVKAEFPNTAKVLWPGSYVSVQLSAGHSRGVVTLPPQSVLEGPRGHFVYVIDEMGKLVAVPVKWLRIQDELAVVEGLKGGEKVVTEGQQSLNAGEVVRVADDKRFTTAGLTQ